MHDGRFYAFWCDLAYSGDYPRRNVGLTAVSDDGDVGDYGDSGDLAISLPFDLLSANML